MIELHWGWLVLGGLLLSAGFWTWGLLEGLRVSASEQ